MSITKSYHSDEIMPLDSSDRLPYPPSMENRLNTARARLANSLLFVVDGAGFGIWAALLPTLQAKHALSEGELGGAMFGMVVGAVVSMLAIGQMISRHGSRTMLAIIAPLFAMALIGPMAATTYVAVVGTAVVFGALKGAFDVAINSQALVIEQAMERPIMASFQACWSIGGLSSALFAGLALRTGVEPSTLTAIAAVALLIPAVACSRSLLTEPPVRSLKRGGRRANAAVLQVGTLAFVALFTEGVMMDWSAVYAVNVAGAATWLAPVAYGAFCCAMAFGRLIGDRLVVRLSAPTLLRISGAMTVGGIGLIASVHFWPVTIAGLLLAGLGLANLVPIFLNAAGSAHPGGAARGVAAVSTIGYVGFLAGPPLIGWWSGSIGLPWAFATVALLASFIAITGPRLVAPRVQRSVRRTEKRVGSFRGEEVVA